MDIWVRAGQLMLSLSILVILHEFGHYLPAILFKTRVEKFYLFFNPWFSLFKKKIGDTEWGIGWLPLGGFVKIAGMVDESMDKEQMALPPQPWEFRSKKVWQRLIIMIGGVTVNLFVGIFIYIMVVYASGEKKLELSAVKSGLEVHPYLAKYGLVSGDLVLALDNEPVLNALDPNVEIMLRGKRNLKVKHEDGSISQVKLPEQIEYELFKEGAFPAFGLRHKSVNIEYLLAVSEFEKGQLQIKKSDVLYQINGAELNQFDLSKIDPNGKTNLSLVRAKDTLAFQLGENELKQVLKCFPSFKAGLLPKDRMLEINGRKIEFFDDITRALYEAKGKKADLVVKRGDSTMLLSANITAEGKLGFAPKSASFIDEKGFKQVDYTFGESISRGCGKAFNTLSDYASQLKFLFTEKGATSIGGFGSMGKLFPPVWDWEIFWLNTALISLILAFMNILPIPALDGGHVIFLIYEMITGKEAPQKVLEYAQYAGIIFLLGLMLYANGNDIYQAFFK